MIIQLCIHVILQFLEIWMRKLDYYYNRHPWNGEKKIVRAEIECQPAVAADKKTKDDVAETRRRKR